LGRPLFGSGANFLGSLLASRKRPAQQHFDVCVDAAEFVARPADQRVMDGQIDAEQNLPALAHA
jgi:hypothetical protein